MIILSLVLWSTSRRVERGFYFEVCATAGWSASALPLTGSLTDLERIKVIITSSNTLERVLDNQSSTNKTQFKHACECHALIMTHDLGIHIDDSLSDTQAINSLSDISFKAPNLPLMIVWKAALTLFGAEECVKWRSGDKPYICPALRLNITTVILSTVSAGHSPTAAEAARYHSFTQETIDCSSLLSRVEMSVYPKGFLALWIFGFMYCMNVLLLLVVLVLSSQQRTEFVNAQLVTWRIQWKWPLTTSLRNQTQHGFLPK